MNREKGPWLVALGLALGPAVSNGLARFSYGLVLPAMRQDLSWSYTEAGWIGTASSVGYLVGAIATIRLIDLVGARRLFLTGMTLTAGTLVATAYARSLPALAAWRFMTGLGGGPVFIAGSVLAASVFPDARRNTLAVALYFGGGGFGMLLTGAVLPSQLSIYGASSWPTSWLLMGAAAVLSCIPAAICVRALRDRTTGNAAAPGPVRSTSIVALLTSYFLFAVGNIVYLTFIVTYLRDAGGDLRLASMMWVVVGLAIMLSPFLWRPLLARAKTGGALALACAATGFGTLLPILVGSPSGPFLSALAFGLSTFMGPAAVTAFARRNLPASALGKAVAVFTVVFAVGQTVGPMAAGMIGDATNGLDRGLLAAASILLLAAISAMLQRELTSAPAQVLQPRHIEETEDAHGQC